jgi:hypothetical protein
VNVAIFAGLFIDNPWHLPPDTWRLPSEDGQLSQDDRANVAIFAGRVRCESSDARRPDTRRLRRQGAQTFPMIPANWLGGCGQEERNRTAESVESVEKRPAGRGDF